MTQTPQNIGNIAQTINTGLAASKNLGASGSSANNLHVQQAYQSQQAYNSKERPATLLKNTANTSSQQLFP